MSKAEDQPDDPFDPSYWTRRGAESGRRNEPRTPDGTAPLRAELLARWQSALRAERLAVLEALDAISKRRLTVHRQLQDVHAQAAADPRQATTLNVLLRRDRELIIQRQRVCDQYSEAIDSLTQQAHTTDAIWRAANERHRDRRMSLEPTAFDMVDSIRVLPPDPIR